MQGILHSTLWNGFNPRSRKGNDTGCTCAGSHPSVSIHVPARGTTKVSNKCCQYLKVSIHVPARGTTFGNFYFSNKHTSFNPRSRKGNDRKQPEKIPDQCTFQSTFPQGERQEAISISNSTQKFQSTFPQGERRFNASGLHRQTAVSIHVPARGTTTSLAIVFPFMEVSIHVPARGTTPQREPPFTGSSSFNPRSRKGND